MVLGSCGSGKQIAAALTISLAAKQTEIVVIDSLDDINPDDGDVLICDDEPTPNRRQLAVLGFSMSCLTAPPVHVDVPYIDNSFRGGSRGKGGKVKYTRK